MFGSQFQEVPVHSEEEGMEEQLCSWLRMYHGGWSHPGKRRETGNGQEEETPKICPVACFLPMFPKLPRGAAKLGSHALERSEVRNRAGDMAELLECCSNTHEALGSSPRTIYTGRDSTCFYPNTLQKGHIVSSRPAWVPRDPFSKERKKNK